MSVAWVLNFDADDELARPMGYTPPRAMEARARALAGRLEGLVLPMDRVLWEGDEAKGQRGRAFCPTPRALTLLKKAGAELPPAPSLDTLQRVNHRRFGAELGQPLEHAAFVTTLNELEATLARAPNSPWLLKRAFGFAGRGKRRLRGGALEPEAASWIAKSLGQGGLQAEPLKERVRDFALHGFLDRSGALILGAPTLQRVDAQGAWVATELAAGDDLRPSEQRALFEEAEKCSRALSAAGYFGPFGIDAFRYATEREPAFHPRCDLNARYTMGYGVGMRGRRVDV